MRSIGVFGGTFDPIHMGHLVIASECRAVLGLDEVRFVPAGQPPHKPDQPITPAAHRLAMLEAALSGEPDFCIDQTDLLRSGPSYTKDLLADLAARNPDARLVFIIGADSLDELHTWREPDWILEIAEIAAARRPGINVSLADVESRLPSARGRIHLVDTPLIGIASRDLRERVRVGKPIRFLVPAPVERYIRQQHLYV